MGGTYSAERFFKCGDRPLISARPKGRGMIQGRHLGALERCAPIILIGAAGLGLSASKAFPHVAAGVGWLVPTGIFVVIATIMAGTEWKDIFAALKKLKTTATALGLNFLFTPLFAWFLGYLFLRQHPDIWVGLILYLITPCIGWYLIFIDLAEGNVALGVALLAWNILLQILLMPVYLYVLAARIITIDLVQIAESVGFFLAAPLLLATFARRAIVRAKGAAVFWKVVKPRLSPLKLVTLILVIVAMFASQGQIILERPGLVGLMILPSVPFFVVLFSLSLILGRALKLDYPDTALLAFTTTARNSEASVAIAVSAFPANPLVALTVVIGPAIELPVLLLLSRVVLGVRGRLWGIVPAPPAKVGDSGHASGVGGSTGHRRPKRGP